MMQAIRPKPLNDGAQRIDVGGRYLFLKRVVTGFPTIIFERGMGDNYLPGLSSVIVLGLVSDPTPKPRTSQDVVKIANLYERTCLWITTLIRMK